VINLKKVSKKIFMIFFLFFGFVAITNAESKKWIEYDWSIKQGLSSNWLYYDHTIEDTDGYVTTSVDDYGSGVLRKISKDGKKVIWEEYDYNAVFLTVALDDSYYYTVQLYYMNYLQYKFQDTNTHYLQLATSFLLLPLQLHN